MQIEQLLYFRTIVEKKTYLEAADVLNLSQSSLSKQIMKLEKEIAISLFDRSKRQIKLTKAGEQFYRDSEQVMIQFSKMMNHLQEIKNDLNHEIKIAMLPIQAQYRIGEVIKKFRQQNPQIIIHTKEIEERDFHVEMIQEDYDILILREKYQSLRNFISIPIYQDRIVAVVSNKHRLANKNEISIEEIENEKLLLLPTYTKIKELCIKACEEAGFHPDVIKYARPDTILHDAKENEGIALVMETSLKLYQLQDVEILHFKQDMKSTIYIYVSKKARKRDAINQLLKSFGAMKMV